MMPQYRKLEMLPESNDSPFQRIARPLEHLFSYHRFWLSVSLVSHVPWMYTLGLCVRIFTTEYSPGGGLLWILPVMCWVIAMVPIALGGFSAFASEKQTVRRFAYGSFAIAGLAPVIGYALFEYSVSAQKSIPKPPIVR